MSSPYIVLSRPSIEPIDWSRVPPVFRKKVSAVCHNRHDAEHLVEFFGSPRWVPNMPVLLMLPGGPTLIGIAQRKHPMTAAQLRDQACEAFVYWIDLERGDTKGLVMRERGGPLEQVEVLKQIPFQLARQNMEKLT